MIPSITSAQFIYFGGDLGYTFTTYNPGGILITNTTIHHQMKLNIYGMHRPLRFLGVGLGIGIPLIQGNNFSFDNSASSTPDGSYFTDFEDYPISSIHDNFQPEEYSYDFKQSPSLFLFGRYYLDVSSSLFIDLRCSFFSVEEAFVFKRPSASISYYNSGNHTAYLSAQNINYYKIHKLIVPGFSMGFQPQFKNHLFFNMCVNFDFLNFGSDGFSYKLAHGWDFSYDKFEYVILNSQATGTKVAFSANVGLGYYF